MDFINTLFRRVLCGVDRVMITIMDFLDNILNKYRYWRNK